MRELLEARGVGGELAQEGDVGAGKGVADDVAPRREVLVDVLEGGRGRGGKVNRGQWISPVIQIGKGFWDWRRG